MYSVSHLIQDRCLCLSGHEAHADPKQDHYRVIGASLRPPSHWRRPCGRPRTSWLRAIDTDVQSVNIGIHSAWRKASDRTLWRRIVDMATLHHWACHWRWRKPDSPTGLILTWSTTGNALWCHILYGKYLLCHFTLPPRSITTYVRKKLSADIRHLKGTQCQAWLIHNNTTQGNSASYITAGWEICIGWVMFCN